MQKTKMVHNRPKRQRPEKPKCRECGKLYAATRAGQRFCSPPCRNRHWVKRHPRKALARAKGGSR